MSPCAGTYKQERVSRSEPWPQPPPTTPTRHYPAASGSGASQGALPPAISASPRARQGALTRPASQDACAQRSGEGLGWAWGPDAGAAPAGEAAGRRPLAGGGRRGARPATKTPPASRSRPLRAGCQANGRALGAGWVWRCPDAGADLTRSGSSGSAPFRGACGPGPWLLEVSPPPPT